MMPSIGGAENGLRSAGQSLSRHQNVDFDVPSVTFLTDQFSDTPASDSINDMLGKDLGEWLRAELEASGFEVGEVIAEDYGYGFWLERNDSHYWITQTQLEPAGYEGQPLPKWLIGVDNDPGCFWVWRLRTRPQPTDRAAIAQAIDTILKANAEIINLEWWSNDVYKGDPASSPGGTA